MDWTCLVRVSEDDLIGDIDSLIRSLAIRYVDDSNVLMKEDELQAECFAKLARVIDGGHLLKYPTRATTMPGIGQC